MLYYCVDWYCILLLHFTAAFYCGVRDAGGNNGKGILLLPRSRMAVVKGGKQKMLVVCTLTCVFF